MDDDDGSGDDFESPTTLGCKRKRRRKKSSGYRRKKPRKGFTKKTGKRPPHARSKSRGDKQKTLSSFLIAQVARVRRSSPDHPMFGDMVDGLCRAPYQVLKGDGTEHKSKVSWRKICRTIAKAAGHLSLAEAKTRCWMSSSPSISFNATRDGSIHVFRRTLMVRVVHFLKTPTLEKWEWLNSGDLSRPFDHFCQRGQEREGQRGRVCVNGLTHGAISTHAGNEDRKRCYNGAACLCPGHGPANTKCIFTHPDGLPQPCRNSATAVETCECERPCF